MLRLRSYLADHRPTAIVTWLGLFFLLFYLAGARGTMSFGDDISMLAVTESIATKGSVAVAPETPGATAGLEGRYYSKYGLGQSLLGVPFYLVGAYLQNHLAKPNTYLNPNADPITYWVCLLGIFSGVGAVVFLYLSCTELGFGERASIIATIAFGACTFEWFYARTFMTEVPSTFFMIAAFYAMLRVRDTMLAKWLWWSGFSLGLAALVRLQNGVMLLVFGMWLLCELWIWHRYDLKKRLVSMVAWLAPIVASLITIAAYNFVRFGTLTDVGLEGHAGPPVSQNPTRLGFYVYLANIVGLQSHSGPGLFKSEFYAPLFGLLLGSGKGIFWYAPILIPAVYGWSFFWKKCPGVAGILGVLVASNLLFYSFFSTWWGGGVWGPRFMVQTLPFLMIGLAALIDHGLGLVGWIVVGATAALSLFIQIASILISYIPYEGLMERTSDSFDDLLWNPAYSPIIEQSRYLIHHQYPFDLAYNAYPARYMAGFQFLALLASVAVLGIGVKLFLDGKQQA